MLESELKQPVRERPTGQPDGQLGEVMKSLRRWLAYLGGDGDAPARLAIEYRVTEFWYPLPDRGRELIAFERGCRKLL